MPTKRHAHAAFSLKRRDLLTGSAAVLAIGTLAPAAFAAPDPSLKDFGAARGIAFGCAVGAKDLAANPDLAAAIARDCAIVVPENDMKWGAVEQVRGKPDYQASEAVADFAKRNSMDLRGHTAVWYLNMPAWAKQDITGPQGRDLILKRVRDVMGHFRGRVVEWDVINEMIDHTSGRADGMREWPPFAAGDVGFIADCFFAAKEADPHARLVYNDFGFEYVSAGEDQRRLTALRLMEQLKTRDAPIDGFGIQSHLKVGNNFKPQTFRRFLADIADFGLDISITEFDIDDQRLAPEIEARDAAVAEHARLFLETAFEEPAVKKLLTWGYSNRNTWLNAHRPRKDGIPHRALPLDDSMNRTPMWDAIADCLKNAPDRR
ncbi:endo-1,4-beta-xylanase [Rhizobium sp. CG5]|uniref:endo-1,4-beta-xylanase n=1 Tax=Rhizobium sp. CG5 TaxID=2726076 RepID=UPI0020338DCA|nr:endo-1,4-beta-xylanase [Rhizobium sp. CG5]MCM2476286.1 endo-1,4-beta-xylanase [Rhizobium sp. CG5]